MPDLSFCAFQKRDRDAMSNLPSPFLVRVSIESNNLFFSLDRES